MREILFLSNEDVHFALGAGGCQEGVVTSQ